MPNFDQPVRRIRPEKPPIHDQVSRKNIPLVPMDTYRGEIEELVEKNDSGIIIGETGSGKTTRIPIYLLESNPDAKIAITQPRRVAVRSVSRFVANNVDSRLKNSIGHQIRFDDQTNRDTRANFMTDGILLGKLSRDPLLREYDIVMVDEAHERSLNIDIVLGLLKHAQRKRTEIGLPPLKIIVTSATIDKDKFTNYFDNAPSIEAPGRTFPVEVEYENSPVSDYTLAAAEKVKKIVSGGEPGDILIFCQEKQKLEKQYKKYLILE